MKLLNEEDQVTHFTGWGLLRVLQKGMRKALLHQEWILMYMFQGHTCSANYTT